MRMRGVTWSGSRGHSKPHILNQQPQFAYSLYDFYGATTTIKGSLHGSTLIVKRFSVDRIGHQNGGFSGIKGCKCYIFIF